MIRVVVVDDEALVRDALVAVLGMQEGIEVVGEAARGDEGAALIAKVEPDVAVLDLQMPGLDGIETAVAAAVVTKDGLNYDLTDFLTPDGDTAADTFSLTAGPIFPAPSRTG